jgi:hypothetical protein
MHAMATPRMWPANRPTAPIGGLKVGRKLDESPWISMQPAG